MCVYSLHVCARWCIFYIWKHVRVKVSHTSAMRTSSFAICINKFWLNGCVQCLCLSMEKYETHCFRRWAKIFLMTKNSLEIINEARIIYLKLFFIHHNKILTPTTKRKSLHFKLTAVLCGTQLAHHSFASAHALICQTF